MKFSNQISAIIVALTFLYSINFKSFITVDYLFNQVKITELFCINKEKPQLQCNGKCHLKNVLTEVENDGNENPFSGSNLNYNFELNSSIYEDEIIVSPKLNSKKPSKYKIIQFATCKGFLELTTPPPKS